MSWELIQSNPEDDMFRLYELEEEQSEDIYMTEELLEVIEYINKKGYISGSL